LAFVWFWVFFLVWDVCGEGGVAMLFLVSEFSIHRSLSSNAD